MSSILVTGATGSFGRAFVKRCLDESLWDRVCVFSRDEHKQAQMRDELNNDARLRFFIGDVRDRDRLQWAMKDVDVVVHAAALKRIETGHYNPTEMVKTNVLGAMNVVEAAQATTVEKVVALSSDKAWQPVSAYGQSKALAETIFLSANNTRGANGPIYAVTRYGNVAGSNGSVIPKWRELIERGQDIEITDPECTRFWMRLDQAVDLVLDTIDTMQGGELAIPTLPAYRLGDLATAMGARQFMAIGLPPWEKLCEGMRDGMTSDRARRMSVEELQQELARV